MIESSLLRTLPDIAHGFMTRQGGVSTGRYTSLNCGPGSEDDPLCVEENRRRALGLARVPAKTLLSCYQVHGNDVLHVTTPWGDSRPKADAMVTTMQDVALGILTADCVPLLFADTQAGIIGAAHAGWRGALTEIGLATIKTMRELGARDIKAAIGPCIGFISYEVGPEFPSPFLAKNKHHDIFFVPSPNKPGHFLFNLPGFLHHQLRDHCDIEILSHDTFAENETFFSYRRTFLSGGGDYGRQVSLIALRQ